MLALHCPHTWVNMPLSKQKQICNSVIKNTRLSQNGHKFRRHGHNFQRHGTNVVIVIVIVIVIVSYVRTYVRTYVRDRLCMYLAEFFQRQRTLLVFKNSSLRASGPSGTLAHPCLGCSLTIPFTTIRFQLSVLTIARQQGHSNSDCHLFEECVFI